MHWSRSVRVKVFKLLKNDHNTGVTVRHGVLSFFLFFFGLLGLLDSEEGSGEWVFNIELWKTFFLPSESVNARRQRDALSHSGGKIFLSFFLSFFGLEDPSQSPD